MKSLNIYALYPNRIIFLNSLISQVNNVSQLSTAVLAIIESLIFCLFSFSTSLYLVTLLNVAKPNLLLPHKNHYLK